MTRVFIHAAPSPNMLGHRVEAGSLTWTFRKPAVSPVAEVDAHAVFPSGFSLLVTFRMPVDDGFRPTYLVDITAKGPPDGPAVHQLWTMEFMDEVNGQPRPYVGLPVRTDGNRFEVALPNSTEQNRELLAETEWSTLTVDFSNGVQGRILLEKGLPGRQLLAKAIGEWDAWRSKQPRISPSLPTAPSSHPGAPVVEDVPRKVKSVRVRGDGSIEQEQPLPKPWTRVTGSSDAVLIGSFGEWGSYVREGRPKTCYALTKPVGMPYDGKNLFFITNKPQLRIARELSIMVNQVLKAGVSGYLRVGGRSFPLVARGKVAWLQHPPDGPLLSRRMESVQRMEVELTASSGTRLRRIYSTQGFKEVIRLTEQRC